LREVFKKARKEFREYKKALNKARFKAKSMPRILKLFKPMIEKSLADMDLKKRQSPGGAVQNMPNLAQVMLAVAKDFVK
jgi:hypothetical protein